MAYLLVLRPKGPNLPLDMQVLLPLTSLGTLPVYLKAELGYKELILCQ